jgi:hypothetical protein
MAHYNYDKIITDYQNGLSTCGLHDKYGISEAYAWRIVRAAGVGRDSSEAAFLRHGNDGGWRKLIRLGGNATRLVSIPSKVLKSLGFDVEKELRGKWLVENGKLCLVVSEERQKMARKGTLSSRAAGLILLPGAGRGDVKVPLKRSGQLHQAATKRRKTAMQKEELRCATSRNLS